MAGITGKGSLSIKKQDVSQSKVPALGFKKTVFAHKATAGSTVISLSALTTPTEMTANGFAQPNVSELTSVNIRQFKENFTLVSSIRGTLQPFLSYVVSGGTSIKLLFNAEDGEIFIGTFDYNPRTFTAAADAIPISVSDTLLAGSTDFNVGTAFSANLYPGSQHGAVMVFRKGRIQYRNTGNNPPGVGVTGDYYEVPAGNGLAVIIRFNVANPAEDEAVSAVSIGSMIQAPTGSEIAMIEALQGQIDSIVPTVAALAGVPESTFQAAPNNVNLKAFGDTVLSQGNRITVLENVIGTNTRVIVSLFGASNAGAVATAGNGDTILFTGTTLDTSGGMMNLGTGIFTASRAMRVRVSTSILATLNATTASITTRIFQNANIMAEGECHSAPTAGRLQDVKVTKILNLSPGDQVRVTGVAGFGNATHSPNSTRTLLDIEEC